MTAFPIAPHASSPTRRFWLQRSVFMAVAAGAVGFSLVHWVLQPAGALPGDQGVFVGYAVAILCFLAVLGFLDDPVRWLLGAAPLHQFSSVPEPSTTGRSRYFRLSLDHRVIALQYLATVIVFFCVAGGVAMGIRTELLTPDQGLVNEAIYLSFVTEHGVTMLIVAAAAIMGPFMNYFLPAMIGVRRMAYPRIEALSFWLFLLALLILPTLFLLGTDEGGWTGYAPLADRLNAGHDAYVVTWALEGTSLVALGINFLGTVWLLRAPDVPWSKVNITVWATLVASFLAWLAAPVLVATELMVAFDRALGTGLFVPFQGGSAYLYENLFWMFGHPEVYILAIPALGIMLEVLAVFTRRRVYAHKVAVLGFLAIGALSFGVWQHHLFVSGLTPNLRPFFLVVTELISVPTGVLILSALGTVYRARIRLTAAMLFALAFIPNFLLGGISGVFLADVPADTQLHGSYFVQAHFHFILMGGTIFGLFAACYYWFPRMTGRQLDERLGKLQFWVMWAGFNGTFITLAIVGLMGMSRRVTSYEPSLQPVNDIATTFAYVLGLSILPFLLNLVLTWRRGHTVEGNIWSSRSLEWLTPSPAGAADRPGPDQVPQAIE